MAFESINQPGWSSEVNIIQKEAFHFIGCRGVVDWVWVHWPVWPTSEVERNTKMSISFFWLERAGRWGSSPLTSLADHQKLNIIKNWAFHYFGRRGVADEVQVHQSARQIIRSKHNPKMSISFFLAAEEWWMGFESIDQPGQSLEVEHNQNMSISFFCLERGGRWGLSPSTSLDWSSEVNIIQKEAFHFIGWRRVVDGVWVHWPVWPTSEVGHNQNMSI